MEEQDLSQAFLRLLSQTPQTSPEQPPNAMWQSNLPLTGFLGPQRTQEGWPATWMNMSRNIGGMEWLIPLLHPHLSQEDLAALLSEKPLDEMDPEQARRIQDGATNFALQQEREQPGTFPKYGSQLEALAAALGPFKNLIVRPLPTPTGQYPGRDGMDYQYPSASQQAQKGTPWP